MGGFNTVYLATFCGMAGTAFGLTSSVKLVKPLMSGPGMLSLASNAALKSGPAFVGLVLGINAFGNRQELWQLIRNAGTYSGEFKAVQKEHYF